MCALVRNDTGVAVSEEKEKPGVAGLGGGGRSMKVIVIGTPQEIASLTLELQGMQPDTFIPSDSGSERAGSNQKCSC